MITISASFGAGGSWVAPRVAERLGRRFIDRAIPVGVAEQLAVPLEHALAHDESAAAPGLARLAVALAAPSGVRMPEPTDDAFCREAERVTIEAAATDEFRAGRRSKRLIPAREEPTAMSTATHHTSPVKPTGASPPCAAERSSSRRWS